jgi:alkanesulfonate monooxygenase SsuD/methylene tetrahydromethanopterin reductase-like flavin-dependent oxidoreductase (luciferase family)
MASDGTSLSFGIKTSQAGLGYEEILRIWREADDVTEFQDAWLWDHLVPLRGDVTGAALEAWTLLAALAARTSRLRLGVIVTSNRIRPPAVLAKMAATVDVIAGGRLVFGIDVVPAGEALTALAETCELVKRLWSEEEPFDFDGSCVHRRRLPPQERGPRRSLRRHRARPGRDHPFGAGHLHRAGTDVGNGPSPRAGRRPRTAGRAHRRGRAALRPRLHRPALSAVGSR